MTKVVDVARPSGVCCGSCSRTAARPVAGVHGFTDLGGGLRGATSGAVLNRRGASSVRLFGAGLLKTLSLYREMVDIEIGRGSEHGARWWSRRLVRVSEEAGLVRLDE